jgi:hypothetical protein
MRVPAIATGYNIMSCAGSFRHANAGAGSGRSAPIAPDDRIMHAFPAYALLAGAETGRAGT